MGLGAAAVSVVDAYAVRHKTDYCTMTDEAYRLHRLIRAGVWGALAGASLEHFLLGDNDKGSPTAEDV